MDLRCSCGGHVYTLDDMLALSDPDPEGVGWADMWRSILGPFDLYCSDEDEVLTEGEAWRSRGLTMPVHDDLDPAEQFPEDMELVR